MEQADILKISMTVEEARAQIAQLPENHRGRLAGRNLATSILALGLTPAQAQATLVLAWNRVLDESRLAFPVAVDREREALRLIRNDGDAVHSV